MANYFDGLNDFYKLNEQERLVSSAQLVYLHLLHINNRSGNGGYVQVSDRELETMTSLAKQSITRAKQTLKNRGLVDFKTERGKPTTFTLKFFVVEHQVGHPVGHLVGQNVGQSSRLSINPKPNTQNKTEETRIYNDNDDARTRDTKEVDDLLEYWDSELGGGRLSFEHQSEIATLAKRHGFEWVKAAMNEASDANGSRYGLNMRLFRGVVERPTRSRR